MPTQISSIFQRHSGREFPTAAAAKGKILKPLQSGFTPQYRDVRSVTAYQHVVQFLSQYYSAITKTPEHQLTGMHQSPCTSAVSTSVNSGTCPCGMIFYYIQDWAIMHKQNYKHKLSQNQSNTQGK